MGTCATCGNDYDKTFTVSWNGTTADFDSIECAAAAMAPSCAHCGCRILGHGLETGDATYCCGHCARESGVVTLLDRHQASAL
jgi:DNA-directed RNA polymerase subunit RPC12/RpoP